MIINKELSRIIIVVINNGLDLYCALVFLHTAFILVAYLHFDCYLVLS